MDAGARPAQGRRARSLLKGRGQRSNMPTASALSAKGQELDMRSVIAGAAVIVAICSVSIAAQWPKYQAPGVPRDAEGRVAMDAPAPRMADGKP